MRPVDGGQWRQIDVVGIGALNLDYIVTAGAGSDGAESAGTGSAGTGSAGTGSAGTAGVARTALVSRLEKLMTRATGSFDKGTEKLVDAATIDAALQEVDGARCRASLGGSAFNAVYALSRMELGMSLGFVGVAGRVPVPGLSSIVDFDEYGVDREFVRVDNEQSCGICLSFVADGDRTLLTRAGANAGFARFIDEEFDRSSSTCGAPRSSMSRPSSARSRRSGCSTC